ncbi:receptor-type tyrosine-protein phosphatase T-like [Mya arenaria]|uniref:receptor-type tyrosine-protein phosphatase T-like n=1 Tax=Mya arenaria TaxID=6604 RepID=UPI0022DF65B3|nr:receptor-type tyrosine-protein phosphatase T-like [Mya arenaria]
MELRVHLKVENVFTAAHLATQQLFVLKFLKITVISNQNDQTPSGEKTCSEMINEDGSFEFDDDDAIEKENVIRSEENGGVYYNNALEVNKTKVKVDELPLYVTAKPKSSFQEEFERIPNGLTKPYEDSQQARNMSRNRYKGIYPYDDSRVKVWFDGSDYINASVIDGFNERNAYIATLGPMSKQLGDFGLFWEMVWQQHVEKVVMVTNLIEEKKVKCDQYWPNVESSALYGNVYVICLSEEKYAEFTRRTFQISRNSEGRELHQFHFTCWPDRRVPEDVAPLVEFRKMVLNTKTKLNGPTLVHCSAGVGRTGTYIAFDILTKEGEAEGSINVPGCVLNIRQNRPNMIQTWQTQFTAEQYSEKESQAIERNKKLKAKIRVNADFHR